MGGAIRGETVLESTKWHKLVSLMASTLYFFEAQDVETENKQCAILGT